MVVDLFPSRDLNNSNNRNCTDQTLLYPYMCGQNKTATMKTKSCSAFISSNIIRVGEYLNSIRSFEY